MSQPVLLAREKRWFTTTSEPFAKACLGLPDRDAEANELVAPLALANARIELATGEKIDGRRLLGEHASSRLSSAAQR